MTLSRTGKSILIILTINLLAGLSAFAETSYELTCRNKAKEIAAENYKNCVTENRQSQIEQIRSDYKEKMANLKDHYDNELKKISGKSGSNSSAEPSPKTNLQRKSITKAMRSSGARSLPKKSVRSEVIDLSAGASDSLNSNETTNTSQNRLNNDGESAQDLEIVELPAQE